MENVHAHTSPVNRAALLFQIHMRLNPRTSDLRHKELKRDRGKSLKINQFKPHNGSIGQKCIINWSRQGYSGAIYVKRWFSVAQK